MLDILLKGILTGFILSIMIGPVFFLLLETSIRKGIRAAIAFDIGVFLSDFIYIIIALIFYSEVSKITSGEYGHIISIVGGIILMIFGLVTLLKKPKEDKKEAEKQLNNQKKDMILLGLKGFLLNFANPGVIFYWITVIALGADGKKNANEAIDESTYWYILIIMVTFFSVDMLKIFGAKKLRPFITENVLVGLNRLIGLIIIGTGVLLVIKGFLAK
ncbi:MAG: Lysine exporter protein [Fluviicola sp.]|uniref:LysE family translocator n=1 Tax=Fluviicola sp. TaxID=1917219 RepID=UPI002631C919|nr:LysE family translocator [Fluviicola sp.]MDF3028316.1 Lysine exporter protein [Fluviicola sp.]